MQWLDVWNLLLVLYVLVSLLLTSRHSFIRDGEILFPYRLSFFRNFFGGLCIGSII